MNICIMICFKVDRTNGEQEYIINEISIIVSKCLHISIIVMY